MRKIIHIDMDSFYPSVEKREHPELRDRPLVVGGPPDSRAVVCSADYIARRYGVRSAMPCSQARRLCPDAIFLPPRFSIYKEVSRQIRTIFRDYTELVEPLSLDEAYLDVTDSGRYAVAIAREIRSRVATETGLTCSAGVAGGKFVAKVASGWRKPDAMTVILPEQTLEFISALPVAKFHGIGPAIAAKMERLGIRTGADLRRHSEAELMRHFGKSGLWFYRIARGIDDRPVEPHRERKSLGVERTFAQDIADESELLSILHQLAAELLMRCERADYFGERVTLKIRYADFSQRTFSQSRTLPFRSVEDLVASAGPQLLRHVSQPLRLMGLTVVRSSLQGYLPLEWNA